MTLLALLLACGGSGPGDPVTTPSTGTGTETSWPTDWPTAPEWTATTGPAVELRALAEAEGWAVQDGAFAFSTMEHCCDIGVSCLGNNPNTPYGMVALPPAPHSQLGSEVDTFWMWGDLPRPGLSRSFRLRQNAAVVVMGELPPEARYLGYRSSVATRLRADENQRELAVGSMGPVSNHLTLAVDRGVEPSAIWSTRVAFVTTADHDTEAQVDAWLEAIGFEGVIHHDRISAGDALMGAEPESDTMMIAARIAVPTDPAALEAYQADPPLQVVRLVPPPGTLRDPMEREPLPAWGSGRDELAWEDALTELQQGILQRFAGRSWTPVPVESDVIETFDCMEDFSCIGDVRDRTSTRSAIGTLGDDEVLVVYGVNHARTGRASYANFAVMVQDNWVGATAVDSEQMVGSARPWLDHAQVDDLYATVLARDCSPYPDLTCVQVGTDCPWPNPSEAFWVTWRMYLDPASGAGPLPDELLPDRMLRIH